MGVSYWAILIAALASFFFGAIFYTVFGNAWLAALGKTKADIEREGQSFPVSLIISFVSQILMAWIFAGLLLHLSKSGVPATLRNGVISGAFCWAAFILTTLATNHRFQGASWRLTVVDGAHWLGVLLIQGAILGAFAIRA